jgi:hypothetical protein
MPWKERVRDVMFILGQDQKYLFSKTDSLEAFCVFKEQYLFLKIKYPPSNMNLYFLKRKFFLFFENVFVCFPVTKKIENPIFFILFFEILV